MPRTLTALLLAFTLALSLAVPILAAEPDPSVFSDVPEGAWYSDAVYWAVEQGVTNGVTSSRFSPQSFCTRQQATAFLHRYAGEPKPESALTFSDVSDEDPLRDAVLWCAGAGIAAGIGNGRFDPRSACTRAHIVTFLYRFAQSQGKDVTAGAAGSLSAFSDAPQVPGYAAEAFRWAVSAGLVSGTGGGKLSPNDPCTRAQIVTMLYRWSWRETGYVNKTVPVYRTSLADSETARLRYFSDLPNVPYMGILDFYSLFMLGGMDLTRNGDIFTLAQTDGTKAVIDAAADTLDTPNLTLFTYPPAYKEGPITSAATVAPFLRTGTITADRAAAPAHLDFAAYGIDLRPGADDLYFPLATLSDLFAGYENYYVSFNGRAIYLTDDGLLHYRASAMTEDTSYYDPILDRTVRPADLADFAYRELCFNIDTFYGFPGSAPLNDALAEKGLDQALAGESPEMKALLTSTDLTDYLTGLYKLMGYYLDDKGHTAFSGALGVLSAASRDNLIRTFVSKLIHNHALQVNPATNARMESVEIIQAARKAAFGEETYLVRGDTAVFVFDAFDVDYDGWDAYYDHAAPMPEDALGRLVRALAQADKDPAVRNLVLDLTCNGGGDTNALFAIESLLFGDPTEHMEDLLTGQIVSQSYQVDRNFDGVFDRRDAQVRYDLNFAVLTSICSFSCANILPSDCRDAGIMILGEQSGGGTCPIQENATAEGLPYQLSCFLRILNDAGEAIDEGVPVDADLLKKTSVTLADGSTGERKDYSDFYDLETLSRAIDRFYGTDAAQPAA